MRINVLFFVALIGSAAATSPGYAYPKPPNSLTLPPVDYLPPTTTKPSYVSCTAIQECITAQACSRRGSTISSSQACQSFNGGLGVCCNPVPTTTTPPSLEYLPPEEDPIQVPDNTNVNFNYEVTVKPPPPTTTTRRPTTQAVVLSPEEEEILFWDFRESIPGDPETDYPILDKIPVTSFTCKGKLDGFYADPETRCQVFHVCASIPEADPIQSSFLCPNGTLFNQEVFVCQWWPDVNCASSAQFYSLNSNIGKVPESAPGSGVKISAGAGRSATVSSHAHGQSSSVSVHAGAHVAGASAQIDTFLTAPSFGSRTGKQHARRLASN